MRPNKWFKSQHPTHTGMSIASICSALLAVVLLTGACDAAGGSTSAIPTTNSSRTTPQAIATSSPTPDPVKVGNQIFQHLAAENCSFTAQSVQAKYWAEDNSVDVNVAFGEQWDLSTMQANVKHLVFYCFQGFFTSPHAGFVQVVWVVVTGPLIDAYGNTTQDLPYAHAGLSRKTASNFNWGNLFPDTAWSNQIYDDQWVRLS